MRKILMGAALAVALVALALGAYVLWFRAAQEQAVTRHGETNPHARAIDERYSPAIAMLKAPEGKTPCETAYNAYHAFDTAPDPYHIPRPWGKLPPKDVFIARCEAQPREVQLCLQPRYSTRNTSACEAPLKRVYASNELFDPLRPSVSGKEPQPDRAVMAADGGKGGARGSGALDGGKGGTRGSGALDGGKGGARGSDAPLGPGGSERGRVMPDAGVAGPR